MPPIGSSDQFIHQITQQFVFQRLWTGNATTPELAPASTPYNRLVCRNNTDLFYATGNIVRCCTISPNHKNYKLFKVENQFYEVASLLMNKSGTLLAIIGEEQVDVVSLPTNVMKSSGIYVDGASFKIKNLRGKVRKCVWQTVAANDSTLVVLTDNSQIQAYDLTKSLEVPVIDVDLKRYANFANEEAISIAFGSSKNLAGGLTLYVSTLSNIYAIYPFSAKFGNLATTKEAIDIALEDTKAAMELIQEKYPVNLLDTATSTLNKAAIRQFEYYLHFKSQLSGALPIIKEVRDTHTNNPYELFVVSQTLSDWTGYSLQGPLISSNAGIKDLASIGDNDLVSILASIDANATVTYYAQLAPMLMKYNIMSTASEGAPSESSQTVCKPKYVKPKRGFGFIDNSEEEEKALVKLKQSQESFWKEELTSLDLLQRDKLPVDENDDATGFPTFFGEIDSNRFSVCVNSNKLVLVDCSWVKTFVDDLKEDKIDSVSITANYGITSTEKEPITAFAYIKDDVTSTGEYLTVCRSKLVNDMEVIQIVDKAVSDQEEATSTLLLTEEPYKELPLTYIPSKPFSELEEELESLGKINIGADVKGNEDLNSLTVDSLSSLNSLSVRTIQVASSYTIFGIKLQSRILANLDSLKEQLHILEKVKNEYDGDQKDHTEKLEKLTEKQAKLDERIIKLQQKIFDGLNKFKQDKTLPISEAERNWFKEINSINALVNSSTDNEVGLTKKIENLSLQVHSIIEDSGKEKKPKLTAVEQLELEKRLSKLKNWLQREDKSIEILKDKLTNSLKLIGDK